MHRIEELAWAGGEHAFALDIGGLRAVQDICDAGPMQIFHAFQDGAWRVDYPLAVLRHGLIGAGMPPDEARALVHRTSEMVPLARLVPAAMIVIAAALVGEADDPVGEPTGVEAPPES